MDDSAIEQAVRTLSWIKTAQIVGAFLVAIGVVTEFVAEFFARPLEHRIEAARQTEVGQAREAAAEATKRAEEAAKHEYRPLEPRLRAKVLANLSTVGTLLRTEDVTVQVTYETWASSGTRQFAAELADLMRDAGIIVTGAMTATVYLVNTPYPVEWGYNAAQEPLIGTLQLALRPALKAGNREQAKRAAFQPGQARIHFGGQAVFDQDGSIEVE